MHERILATFAILILAGCGGGGSGGDSAEAPRVGVFVVSVTPTSVTLQLASAARVYLAPEPGAAERILVAEGSGTVVINGLAPSADCFFQIEGTEVHVRTLDGPFRVLGFAPNILLVVMKNPGTVYSGGTLGGNLGASWQTGPWNVTRRDGSPVGVVQVHRHSVPAGQPDYVVNYGGPYNDNIVDVEHHLFLVLDQPVGDREILDVDGPVDFRLPISDRYLETPVVQLNQVGYSPKATERWAYLSGWMGDGGPLSLAGFPSTAEVIWNGGAIGVPITPRSSFDSDAGTEVRQIDLAGVPAAEGVRYRVRIPGVGVSWPTQVSEVGVFKAFYVISRGLYLNRWGRELKPECTEWAPRPADHPTVFTAELADWTQFFPQTTPQTGVRPMVGGHHDAGDFDVRPTHTVVAMLLLRAFEQHAGFYLDGQLTIPESGNGIPDFLDEALWSLAGWEHLQEPDGGVRLGVESWRHPWGMYYADQDPLPYWTYARNANHTARVAGLFAQAAWLVKPYDAARSASLQSRAVAAWNWATANGASDGPKFYAASELYRLTGNVAYKNAYDAMWAASDWGNAILTAAVLPWFSSYTDADQPVAIDYLLGYLGGPAPSSGIVSQAITNLTNRANASANAVESLHAHRNARPAGASPDWGAGTAVGECVIPVLQRLQLGGLSPEIEQSYVNAISLTADYVLGANPHGMVWITGLGSRHPREPLHLDALSFRKDGAGLLPGIPVYGPVNAVPAAPYYDAPEAAFHPSFGQQPLLRRYADCRTFVTTSEFDVGIQARHAELFGALLGGPSSPPASWLPGGADHRKTTP